MRRRLRAVGRPLRPVWHPVRRRLTMVLPYRPTRGGARRLDEEYARGSWSYLRRTDELARFSVVAGLCGHLAPGGRILEIGCGEGILVERLDRRRVGGYLGVDISSEAIAAAAPLRDARTEFAAADAVTFTLDGEWDLVIFNEVLEYFDDPAALVARYAGMLAPGGRIIVSMFTGTHTGRSVLIWRMLRGVTVERDATRVVNRRGYAWDVRVLEPR